MFERIFNTERSHRPLFTWGDFIVLAGIGGLLYLGARLALNAPEIINGPQISLAPSALPWYTVLSMGRMLAAYLLSLVFALVYGRWAAYNHRAEQILIPLLDVLQSVPILSFLPIILLSLSAIFPEGIAAELASILLIFTSQAWNLTFGWYQSLTTIPKELREASSIFRLNSWFRFHTMELPFAAISLVWNSMMSWAGGWFFLMAAEIFTVGQRDFRLPGLGAYLSEAANAGNFSAIAWGLGVLILTIVLLDQLIWRPLLAWSDRFKVEMVENDNPPVSWFYDLLRSSRAITWIGRHIVDPITAWINRWFIRNFPDREIETGEKKRLSLVTIVISLAVLAIIAYGAIQTMRLLSTVTWSEWGQVGLGVGATLLRVLIALVIALAWTIPVGVAIGTNPKWAAVLQPLVQITASVPATALFPIFLLALLGLPGGLNLAAVLLMLMGTQWYLLFNIIAGASAIPKDLKSTATLMHLSGLRRWRILVLPALFPYIITGAITATGGAWNASIVSEYVSFNGKVFQTIGIGSLIAQSTAAGNYALLLAATMGMILVVVLINRLVWRRFYQEAEDRFKME